MSPAAVDLLDLPLNQRFEPYLEDLEIIQKDIDVDELVLDAIGDVPDLDVREACIGAEVEVTIEGAPTITLTLRDPDRIILKLDILQYAIETVVKGWTFRLAKRSKQGENLILTFEGKPAALLRRRKQRRKASRGKMTRAQFVQTLVKSIKPKVRYHCPELRVKQKIERVKPNLSERDRARDRSPGLLKGEHLTIKGQDATARQIRVLDGVLSTADQLGASERVMIAAAMTVIQESNAGESTGKTGNDDMGLFQQGRNWVSEKDAQDPEAATKAFLVTGPTSWKKVHGSLRAVPGGYENAIKKVQISIGGYAQWHDEAQRIVDAFGGPGASGQVETIERRKRYEFKVQRDQTTGEIEDWWTAIQRLANEVQWRAFVVRNTVYFISEKRLYRSKPQMTVEEGEDGVEYIDGDWDDRRKGPQELRVQARLKLWLAPPGTTVRVEGMGKSFNGKWLVHSIQRSLFDHKGTITLKKPMEKLPEPAPETVTKTRAAGAAGGEFASIKGTPRERIIKIAESTMTSRTGFRRYSQPGALTADPTPKAPARTDCSQWTRAVFLKAGLPDIGVNTTAQAAQGRRTQRPQPGDLMFSANTGHVELFLGGGKTIGHGSPPIDYGGTMFWPGCYFVTFPFLDEERRPAPTRRDSLNGTIPDAKFGRD